MNVILKWKNATNIFLGESIALKFDVFGVAEFFALPPYWQELKTIVDSVSSIDSLILPSVYAHCDGLSKEFPCIPHAQISLHECFRLLRLPARSRIIDIFLELTFNSGKKIEFYHRLDDGKAIGVQKQFNFCGIDSLASTLIWIYWIAIKFRNANNY